MAHGKTTQQLDFPWSITCSVVVYWYNAATKLAVVAVNMLNIRLGGQTTALNFAG